MSERSLATLLIRLLGWILIVGGVLSLFGDVLAAWGKVGLVYWRTFLMTIVLPPILEIVVGILLVVFSFPLGRLVSRGLSEKKEELSEVESERKSRFRSKPRGDRPEI